MLSKKEYAATNYRMPSGKHEGRKLHYIPSHYFKSVVKNGRVFDKVTTMHIHREMKRRHKLFSERFKHGTKTRV